MGLSEAENNPCYLTDYPDLSEEFIDLSPEETVAEFVESRRSALKTLRSYLSHSARMNLSEDVRAEMAEEITHLSRGALSVTQGLLCEVSGDGLNWEKAHTGEIFKADKAGEIDAIKGFYFTFYPFQTAYECLVLDHGRSREVYDKKTPEEKRKFVESFASSRDKRFDPVLYPFGYTVVLEQNLNEPFNVLQVVPHPKPKL